MRSGGEDADTAALAREGEGGGSLATAKAVSSLNDIPAVRSYLRRVGAEAVNFRKARMLVEVSGYPREIGSAHFTDDGALRVNGMMEPPTSAEAEQIAEAFKLVRLPNSQPFCWTAKHLPQNDNDVPWSKAHSDNVYVCWDESRSEILFVQERVDLRDGGKAYIPWSYWSDGQWRKMEPDGKLPHYGLEQLKDHGIACIHEGAKAARAVRALLADPIAISEHPWGESLKHMAHLGWLGGAERPTDTDWDALRRLGVTRVVLVCDNDSVGKNVVRPISRAHQLPMDALFFDERWPVGFDLADPFPAKLFQQHGDRRRYIGPSFTDCCHPATWATRKLAAEGRGRPPVVVRREFVEEWIYVCSTGEFVHRRRPTSFLNPEKFNIAVRPVSDVKNTADLLHVLPSVKVDSLCYLPELRSGVVTVDGERKFNTHVPSRVDRRAGSAVPFYRFMTHLLPDKGDRLNVMRWVATLIAVPQVRMGYGLLLCSTAQGIGKSTLTDHILTPLIGPWNVSHPDVHRAVTSGFNSWLAGKRLVVMAEMYVGHLGSKAYDTLKPLMTDKTVTVNEKFRPEYEMENRAHFVASSNSRVPMFMAGTDRRWLVPKVTDRKLPRSYWRRFYSWLADGGLEIIHQWAFDFVAKHGAVAPEDEAPGSSAKAELVEASLSDGRRTLRDLAEFLIELGRAGTRAIVPVDAVKEWFDGQAHLSHSDRKISQRAMLEVFEEMGLNLRKGDHRLSVKRGTGYRKMTAVANFTPADGEEWTRLAESCLWSAGKLTEAFDVL